MQIPDSEWATLVWHAFIIEVGHENPNLVFTGGLNMWNTSTGGSLWKRINDGMSNDGMINEHWALKI